MRRARGPVYRGSLHFVSKEDTVRIINVLTHRGHRVATLLAMIEAETKDVFIHLITNVQWSRDMKRYSFRTR